MARYFRNGIAIDTFDVGADRTALFCNGLPGAIGPLPAVLAANAAGWNVLFIQYPGTYDSDGEFGVAITVETLHDVLEAYAAGALIDPSSGQSPAKRPAVTLAIGHSFGGYILTELVRSFPSTTIQRALLLAPVFTYQGDPDVGIREDLLQHLQYVKASRPRTYRFCDSDGWSRAASGRYLANGAPGWAGQVLAVVGSDDDTFEVDVVATEFERFYRSQTGATDVRLRVISDAGHGMDELLSDEVVDFLK